MVGKRQRTSGMDLEQNDCGLLKYILPVLRAEEITTDLL
jgi:hypothetical protein